MKHMTETIERAKILGFDVKAMDEVAAKASQLLKQGMVKEAEPFMRSIQDYMDSSLPAMVADYVSNSKSILIESKMLGKDITKAIGLIKEAKTAAQRGDYPQCLEYLVAFKKDTSG